MNDVIAEIRKSAVDNIKEKVKRNPGPFGYLHPINKERLDDMERLKFKNGYEFTVWMQNNGIMNNPTDVQHKQWKKTLKNAECKTRTEYENKNAQKTGFKDYAESLKVDSWNRGDNEPVEFKDDCSSHIGCIVGEDEIGYSVLGMIFEKVEKKKFNNPGYDFLCKNVRQIFLDRYPQFKLEINKEYKIDIKTSRFLGKYWGPFHIDFNNITDYFMIIGLREDGTTHRFILFIHKNDIIRNVQFWRRDGIKIGIHHLSGFKKYELIYESDCRGLNRESRLVHKRL